MYITLLENENENQWYQGFACAVAILLKIDGLAGTQTREVYNAGIGNKTEAELIEMGVDESDIALFKQYSLLKS